MKFLLGIWFLSNSHTFCVKLACGTVGWGRRLRFGRCASSGSERAGVKLKALCPLPALACLLVPCQFLTQSLFLRAAGEFPVAYEKIQAWLCHADGLAAARRKLGVKTGRSGHPERESKPQGPSSSHSVHRIHYATGQWRERFRWPGPNR